MFDNRYLTNEYFIDRIETLSSNKTVSRVEWDFSNKTYEINRIDRPPFIHTPGSALSTNSVKVFIGTANIITCRKIRKFYLTQVTLNNLAKIELFWWIVQRMLNGRSANLRTSAGDSSRFFNQRRYRQVMKRFT